uniref:Uncharacterized protein n=1 Tax=Glossina austeni TaxID=7395 RepID=A0A1A9V3D9_GLOAU
MFVHEMGEYCSDLSTSTSTMYDKCPNVLDYFTLTNPANVLNCNLQLNLHLMQLSGTAYLLLSSVIFFFYSFSNYDDICLLRIKKQTLKQLTKETTKKLFVLNALLYAIYLSMTARVCSLEGGKHYMRHMLHAVPAKSLFMHSIKGLTKVKFIYLLTYSYFSNYRNLKSLEYNEQPKHSDAAQRVL